MGTVTGGHSTACAQRARDRTLPQWRDWPRLIGLVSCQVFWLLPPFYWEAAIAPISPREKSWRVRIALHAMLFLSPSCWTRRRGKRASYHKWPHDLASRRGRWSRQRPEVRIWRSLPKRFQTKTGRRSSRTIVSMLPTQCLLSPCRRNPRLIPPFSGRARSFRDCRAARS